MHALIDEIRDDRARIASECNAVPDIPEWGDDPRSVAALFAADADGGFSELAGRAVGESFGRIMMARGALDRAGDERLTPHARWGVLGGLRKAGSPLAEGLEKPPARFDCHIRPPGLMRHVCPSPASEPSR